jgi:hypothetical protein
MRGRRRRDGLTDGGAGHDWAARRARTAEMVVFGHARSGGARTARWWRGSDSGDGVASDRGAVGQCHYGAGTARGMPGGGSALTSGPGAERERLTGGTPRRILF